MSKITSFVQREKFKKFYFYTVILSFYSCVLIHAQEYEESDPNQDALIDWEKVSPVEVGVGGNIKRENPYQLEAESNRPVHLHFLWESRYVSEGRDNLLGDGLASVFSEITLGNFSFVPWFAYGYESEYTELNLNFVYGFRLSDQLEIYSGYTHLQNRFNGENTKDNEVFTDLVYMPTTLFDVLVNYCYSVDAHGDFWEFGLKREQELNEKTALTFRSILGVNKGYVPDGHNGLNHVQLRLNLAYYPVTNIEIIPYLAYNLALDREPDHFTGDVNLRDFFWSGIGIVYHF